MPRVAVVCGHPNLSASRANRALLEAVSELSFVTINRLCDRYNNSPIDVIAEQILLREADAIVLQFPLYWYSCPSLLKTWIDSVFTEGFAHGEGADGLSGKPLMLAVTAAASAGFCAETDKNGQPNLFSLTDALRPFKAMAAYCKMPWEPELVVFSAWEKDDAALRVEAEGYRDRVAALCQTNRQ